LTEKGRLAKFGPASLSLLSKWHVLCFWGWVWDWQTDLHPKWMVAQVGFHEHWAVAVEVVIDYCQVPHWISTVLVFFKWRPIEAVWNCCCCCWLLRMADVRLESCVPDATNTSCLFCSKIIGFYLGLCPSSPLFWWKCIFVTWIMLLLR
jgi:hypothetical protein